MSTELDLYTQDRAARTVPFDSVAFERTFHHEVATLESGVRIHYVRGGTGAPSVLLHGFPQHWREWRPVMPALAAAGHDIIAPDLRGFGESDKPLADVDARTVAEDLRQLLHLPTREPIAVVGHDVDASVAYAWAAQRPQGAAHNRELSRLKLGMPARNWLGHDIRPTHGRSRYLVGEQRATEAQLWLVDIALVGELVVRAM